MRVKVDDVALQSEMKVRLRVLPDVWVGGKVRSKALNELVRGRRAEALAEQCRWRLKSRRRMNG